MEPVENRRRFLYKGGPQVNVADVEDSSLDLDVNDFSEDGDEAFLADIPVSVPKLNTMNDELIKMKAINLAIGIARLKNFSTLDDVLQIATELAIFIKTRKLPTK